VVFWCGAILNDSVHFVACFPAVFSNILKIPQIQVLADSDEQEVVQQVQVTIFSRVHLLMLTGMKSALKWHLYWHKCLCSVSAGVLC
jgi:hypothetical protein